MNKYVTVASSDDTEIQSGTGDSRYWFHSIKADHARHTLIVQVPMGVEVSWLTYDEMYIKYKTHGRVLRAYKYDGVKFNKEPVRIITTARQVVLEEYFGVFEQVHPIEEGLKLYRDYVQVRQLMDEGTARRSALKEYDLPQSPAAQFLLDKIEMQAFIDLRDNENIKEIVVTRGDEETYKVTRDADDVITQTPFTK